MDLGVEMGSKTTIKVPFLYVLNDNESCFKKINTHLRMQQMKKRLPLMSAVNLLSFYIYFRMCMDQKV